MKFGTLKIKKTNSYIVQLLSELCDIYDKKFGSEVYFCKHMGEGR